MKPKEIQQKLGINANRIKFFKREGVFTPENPPAGNRGTNYTEVDFKNLQFLVVLNKMGLTCSVIRKMQNGDCALEEAVNARRKSIEDDIEKRRNALSLLYELIEDKKEFETFHIERYWNIITERESKGEEFIDVEDMYSYRPVSLIRTVKCPYCGEELEVDLEITRPTLAAMIRRSAWVKIWHIALIARIISNILHIRGSTAYRAGLENTQSVCMIQRKLM